MALALAVLLAVLAQAQPPPAPRDRATPSSADTASISGRVTDKETGRPLHRAVVSATVMSDRRSFEAVTDADGRYELTGLRPGNYGVSANAGERRASHLPQGFGRDPHRLGAVPTPPEPIELKARDARVGVDFALTRALAISGRVLDLSGEPMADVNVYAARAHEAPHGPPARTDDRGEFRVFGLAPGRYRVCADNPDASRFGPRPDSDSRLVRTCHPASIVEANAADVVLTFSDASGIDIRVQRAAAFSIAGSVLDAAGAAADGASVVAFSRDETDAVGGSARTQAGQFVIKGLLDGRYVLRASIGGRRHPLDTRKPEREPELGAIVVDVGGGHVAGVTLTMSKSVKLPGRVVLVGGEALPDGPAPTMHLGNEAGEPGIVDREPPKSPVDAKLRFELQDVFRIPQVLVVGDVPDGWALQSVVFAGRDVTGVPTDFASAPEPRDLVVTLTNRVARPSFRVLDERGNPSTAARVVLFPVDPARWAGSSFASDFVPPTDAVVKLSARVPGHYFVAALSWQDYSVLLREPQRIAALAGVARRVTLAEGSHPPIDVRITPLPARQP